MAAPRREPPSRVLYIYIYIYICVAFVFTSAKDIINDLKRHLHFLHVFTYDSLIYQVSTNSLQPFKIHVNKTKQLFSLRKRGRPRTACQVCWYQNRATFTRQCVCVLFFLILFMMSSTFGIGPFRETSRPYPLKRHFCLHI